MTSSSSRSLLLAARPALQLNVLLGTGVWLSIIFSGALKRVFQLALSEGYAAARYTGIPGLDTLTSFHRTAHLTTSAGAPTPRTLQIVHLFCGLGSIWTAMILETCRQKSLPQVLRHTLKWHLANMWIGPHVITPLYCLLHLQPPGTLSGDSEDTVRSNKPLIDYLVPLKVLTFVLPVALMHLPGSQNPPDTVKVHLAMLIHTWPLWVVGAAYLAQERRNRILVRPTPSAPREQQQQLRSVYQWAFYAASASHLVTMFWCLSLGEEASASARLQTMFVPPLPRTEQLIAHPREPIYFVTKWGNALCASAVCIWASVAYLRTCKLHAAAAAAAVPSMPLSLLVLKLSWRMVVLGPYAVAVQLLIWKHDVLSV
ncbi:hypothetical protein BO82DRAFT_404206 [Aspergillus uvarum CBS 121591]|uniref:Uncharacterized protein n=1 Tax=Aspergillus uvarum CBS 121591 TaxID=1448315 RepID=A0A319C6W1_9EURO|nr:hypothetical protein BO82DRAFT_404206 [Aspergillus uvarum CBS 121591]PYH79569.1 hypothetical protein BO82DRAFT_404206 [Aspergillus uvarum CBS 121591]